MSNTCAQDVCVTCPRFMIEVSMIVVHKLGKPLRSKVHPGGSLLYLHIETSDTQNLFYCLILKLHSGYIL